MAKYKVSLTVTYDLKGKLLAEYLEWLDDYRDSEKMRNAFIIDRFIELENAKQLMDSGIIDPKAKIKAEKEKGK
jgi:hypothetical protein